MTEQEFISNYNPADYPGVSIGVDVVVLGAKWMPAARPQQTDEATLMTLLVKRTDHPYKDKLALPGGFVAPKERLEDAARRVLKEKTGLGDVYLEQLYTFDSIDRDPRTRVISVAFIALVNIENLDSADGWVPVRLGGAESERVKVRSAKSKSVKEGDAESEGSASLPKKQYFKLGDFEPVEVDPQYEAIGTVTRESIAFKPDYKARLAFDHDTILLDALARIRNKVLYTDVLFGLLPETFRMDSCRRLCEAISGRMFARTQFNDLFSNKLVRTGEKTASKSGPAAQLYTYNPNWWSGEFEGDMYAMVRATYNKALRRFYLRVQRGQASQTWLDTWKNTAADLMKQSQAGYISYADCIAWIDKS